MRYKPFILRPGTVVSTRDGDLHYITAMQLCDLYRVHPKHCIHVLYGHEDKKLRGFNIELAPRVDGDYKNGYTLFIADLCVRASIRELIAKGKISKMWSE